ncbi:YeeE/YedE family protein [Vulgatibacter sp.]|uniref:YeeE/YedE family protein n=1 Tax=Vulgatibacter sp. TaxID=1971226 RepID=UPI003567BB99
MDALTPFLLPLLGGALIGLASALLLLGNGRIAGISGIIAGLVLPSGESRPWRAAFVGGMLAVGAVFAALRPEMLPSADGSLLVAGAAGILVGFGTRLGSGCTSGHGVCGISRFSPRSLAATLTFIATGAVTVFVMGVL